MPSRSKSSTTAQGKSNKTGNNNFQISKSNDQGSGMNNNNGKLDQLFNRDEVPPGLREPYIFTGYRKPNITFKESFQLIFHINNETFNIWSHVLATLYFIVRYTLVLLELGKPDSPQRDFYYPMLSSAIGTCTVFGMSSIAHIFNSKSEHMHSVFYFFDYAGISIYTYTSGQVMFFYNRPINTGWRIFESALLYTAIGAFLSFLSTFLSCLVKFAFKSHKTYGAIARVVAVFAGWINTILSLVVGITICSCHAVTTCQSFLSCNEIMVSHFMRHCFYAIAGGIIYASRLPERLLPGKFDMIGNSHHFLHIFAALSTEYAFKILGDALQSRRYLENERLTHSLVGITVLDTILPTLIVFVGNFAISCWFARLLYKKIK